VKQPSLGRRETPSQSVPADSDYDRDPREAIAESCRVLRPGGLFVACAPSRHNDPELAAILCPAPAPQTAATFDAENGPEMARAYFAEVEVERWDAPLVHSSGGHA
jgi:SAM-dependent methyltransferase